MARSGSVLFWSPAPVAVSAGTSAPGIVESEATPDRASHYWALAMLLMAVLACSVAAGPLSRYATAASAQLFERDAYLKAVLQAEPVPAAIDVRREMREREARHKAAGIPDGAEDKP